MVEQETVKRVADNAMIDLESPEVEELAGEMEEVLEMFDSLEEVETDGVEPSFIPIEEGETGRKDKVEESLSREEIFANTENREDDMFRGPPV